MSVKAFVFDVYGTLFDPQTVAAAVEKVFPAQGEYIAYVWRQKQLEYSWQRTVMGAYADFAAVTRDALIYTLSTLELAPAEAVIAELCEAFQHLQPFADAREALVGLAGHRLAVFSNGSPAMLTALLDRAKFSGFFEHVISVDAAQAFKPHPDAYRLTTTRLGLAPHEIMLVSSNGFDLAGAKHFGLKTVRIARTSSAGPLRERLADPKSVAPGAIFTALRGQLDSFGGAPDFECGSLHELAALAPSIAAKGAN